MFYSSINTSTLCLFLYKFDSIRFTNHVNGYSHPYRFSLRQNLRLLLTLFESKPHLIIIFHLKTNRQKLEKHHVNGSRSRSVLTFQHVSFKIATPMHGKMMHTESHELLKYGFSPLLAPRGRLFEINDVVS